MRRLNALIQRINDEMRDSECVRDVKQRNVYGVGGILLGWDTQRMEAGTTVHWDLME